jgi:hypothetical protein
MDNITALTPGMVDPALADPPPIEPLEVIEDQKEPVRSKLRLSAILVSLYVYYLAPS